MLAAQVSDRDLAERNVLLLLQDSGGDAGPKLGLARSRAGATALHYAAGAAATARCVRALCDNAPVAVRCPSRRGGTPLHWACAALPPRGGGDDGEDHACETIDALLDCGADPNATTEDAPPPLFVCLAAGQERRAARILDRACRDSRGDEEGPSAAPAISLRPTMEYELPGNINLLHMAADLNLVGFLKRLLEYCAELSSSSNDNGNNSGSDSTGGGPPSLLDRLLGRRNGQGLTPLEVAAREGHAGCAALLLPPGPPGGGGGAAAEERALELVRELRGRSPPPERGGEDGAGPDAEPAPPSAPDPSGLPPKPEGEAEPDPIEQQAREEAGRLVAVGGGGDKEAAADQAEAERCRAEGNALFAKKEYERACQMYGEAIQYDPRKAEYYSNRSACHLLLGQPESALRDAAFAHALRPGWPKASYRLSAARLALGRHEDAAVAAWEGLARDPDSGELRALLQRCVREGREEHLRHRPRPAQPGHR
jgi:tetratricopeptide (TPR) repeat protein